MAIATRWAFLVAAVLGLAASRGSAQAPSAPSLPAPGGPARWDFEGDAVGGAPQGFTFGRTGKGSPGRWTVRTDPTAPAGPHVLTQVDADATDNRMPVALADAPVLDDLRVEVRCKPVWGVEDQACGLVFRAQGEKDYYVARANALEDDVRLFAVVGGERRQLAAWKGKVAADAWHSLAVEARGPSIQVSWDGKPVIQANDGTLARAGRVGLWTKSDSLTYFDALVVTPLGAGATAAPVAVAGATFPRGKETPSSECARCHAAVQRESELVAPGEAGPAHLRTADGGAMTCATCHLTPDGLVRGLRQVTAPHGLLVDPRLGRSDACTPCHGLDQRVPGQSAQTFLQWREDYVQAGLGSAQCQDCHMPRTLRRSTDAPDDPMRVSGRHLWSAGPAGLRPGGALLVELLASAGDTGLGVRVVNAGAGHSVPTSPGRRAFRLAVRALDVSGKVAAEREWSFTAASTARVEGPATQEPPLRAGEERVLPWKPSLAPGAYSVEAVLTSEPGGRELGRWSTRVDVKGK